MNDISWHPYIVEDDEFKLLQFSEWDIQSKMRKAAPNELVFSYTQAMVAFMLFVATPKNILVVGLGGGSLSKFCYHYLPATRITTVEISQEVIDLRNDFCVPPDNDRFRVIHADIASWLDGKKEIADVILLDGYGDNGIPKSLSSMSFHACCRAALTATGILVANINLGAIDSSTDARTMLETSVGQTIQIRSAAGYNDILLAFRNSVLPPVKILKARALALREETGVDFPLLLDKLRSSAGQARGSNFSS